MKSKNQIEMKSLKNQKSIQKMTIKRARVKAKRFNLRLKKL